MQGGERQSVGSGSGKKGEGGSGNVVGDARVVGRILTTQIPTSLPRTSIVTKSTITTRSITKRIVIGTAGGELRSSKPNLSEQEKDKGKGISQELSKEEKKAAQEAEMAKQRQIQSILHQSANDPPSLDKGDPVG